MSVQVVKSFNSPMPGTRYQPGDEAAFSEDVIGGNGRVFWVIDGATHQGDHNIIPDIKTSIPHWYAQNLSFAINALLMTGHPQDDVRSLFSKGLSAMQVAFTRATRKSSACFKPHNLPSAAGLCAVYNAEKHALTFAGLGDCMAIIEIDNKIYHVTKKSDLSATNEAARIKKIQNGTHTQADEQKARRLMNRHDGYWILSVQGPEAANHLVVETVPLPKGKSARVLLTSDGLGRLIETYGATPKDLMAMIKDLGFEATTEILRCQEKINKNGHIKVHDDVSGYLLECSQD